MTDDVTDARKPWATWVRPEDGATMGMDASGHTWVITTPVRELERRVALLEEQMRALLEAK